MKIFGGKKDKTAEQVTDAGAAAPAGEAEAPRAGLFGRMKQAVSRTRESFSAKIEDLVALTRTVDEAALEDLEAALLTSDLGVQTTTDILEALRDRAKHQAIEGGAELRALLKDQLRAILEGAQSRGIGTDGRGAGCAAAGDVSGGRERDREDDLGGQAGGVVSRAGADCAAVRGGYLPGGGHRTA